MLHDRTLAAGQKCSLLFTTALLLVMASPFPTLGQVLEEEINRLLGGTGECTNLGTFSGNDLGDNLSRICSIRTGNTSFGVSGAASVQGSAVSILNRALLGRLEEMKDEGTEDRRESSSMTFTPFGFLSMTTAGGLNINSPFYATYTGEGSTGSFYTSSQKRWKGLGFFSTGRIESLNREVTKFEDGYKSTILGFLAGIDYRISKNFVAGLLGNYTNTNGDFRGGGTFSTNSYGFLAFAQMLPNEGTFIQMTAGYTRNNYLVGRAVNESFLSSITEGTTETKSLVTSNSNGNVANAGVLAGYDHPIGRFLIGPRAGFYYTRTHIGDYRENGNDGTRLAFDDQHIDSLQSTFGLFGSTNYSTQFGVLIHQVSLDYVHEFMNHQRLIKVQFAEDFRSNPTRFTFQNSSPARDYANVGTGVVIVLPNGWQPFVNFRAMVGNEQFTNYAGSLGLRVEL